MWLIEILLLLLLTAIGLSPGGSSPTLVQTKIKIHTTVTTEHKRAENDKTIKISTQTEQNMFGYQLSGQTTFVESLSFVKDM
jgi:hypothetical protein